MIEDGAETAKIQRAKRVGRDQDIQFTTVASIANCVFVPAGAANTRSSTEETGDRSQTITSASLFAPPGAPVPQATDYIEVRGLRWQCEGEASVWRDLSGETQGYEQRLRRVVG
jgi:hypothetical protein